MFSTYAHFIKRLHQFSTKDGTLSYFDEGKGDCILLLHGVPTSSWLYRKIIPILLENEYRVVAPDMLGYGNSEKPAGYNIYSEQKMGARLLELMDHLEIKSWSHVFHDGGGLWTWEMLKLDKTRVNHLFMLNTIVYQEGFKPPIKFEKGWLARMFTRLYSLSPITQMLMLNPTFKNGLKNKSVVDKTMLEGYKAPLLKNGHYALNYFFSQTKKPLKDYSDLHRGLDIPMTVIWGKHDDMLVWECNNHNVKVNFEISDKDIYLIDAKHFIQEEKPEEIAQLIVARLK